MNPLVRTIALFLGLLAVVVVASLVMVKYTRDGAGEGREAQTAAPAPSLEEGLVPLNADLVRGLDALKRNELSEARESFAKVPESDASYFEALRSIAMIEWQTGEFEAAEAAFLKLSALQPDNPEAHISIGWAQYRLGRLAEAESSVLRAIELDGNSVAARYDVAFFRLAQGMLPEAIKAYSRAVVRDGAQQYFGTARQHLLQLLEERPDLAEIHYALAYFAHAINDRILEIEELEKYLAMNPTGPAVEVARSRLADAREAVQR
jgi:tetratricopeptide (TPR) repeat protein